MKVFGLLVLILATGSLVHAADVTLSFSWAKNTESDLAGYRLYRSTVSGQYGVPVATITGQTTYTSTIPQTEVAQTYYHVLTAINTSGMESRPTVEVASVIPALPIVQPVIGLRVLSATPDEVVISAPTSECPRIQTSTKGSTAAVLKRTVRCLR